jgi:redox-sensitive bicupin YhaK (pirin superfamily)
MSLEVRRSGDRFVTEAEGRVTRHSFSFDRHYDPTNVGLGFLICHNEDLVQPGHGYPDHPHRDLEIVTWVLGGALRHTDGSGSTTVVMPGTVQRLSAGSGVVHAEVNDGTEPVHFVQMWVRPSESGLVPSYVHTPVSIDVDGWTTLAGQGHAVVPIANPDAYLKVARLGADRSVVLPDAPLLHLFVARGTVEVEDAGILQPGDALRATDGGRRVTAADDAELLLWAMG